MKITRRQLRRIIREYKEMLAKDHVDGHPWSGSLTDLADVQGKTWGHGEVVDPKGFASMVKLSHKFSKGTAPGMVESSRRNRGAVNEQYPPPPGGPLQELAEAIDDAMMNAQGQIDLDYSDDPLTFNQVKDFVIRYLREM